MILTKIKRGFEFQAAVYYEDKLIMNRYQIMAIMNVETDSIREQNVAMDRLKYLFSESLMNAVFISNNDKKAIENYNAAGIKVCILPEEPYDQIITLVLLLKMNAVTEGRLAVTEITLKSDLSDGVMFIYDDSVLEVNHPFNNSGWWSESSSRVIDSPKTNKKEKIVKLVKQPDWCSLNLDWKEKDHVPKAEIVFTTDFDKS